MFWKHVKGIIENLPLILSDTREAADVSLNRVITFGAAICLAIIPGLVLWLKPEFWPQMADLWKAALTFLGAQAAGNIYAKVVRMRQTPPGPPGNFKMGKARVNDIDVDE